MDKRETRIVLGVTGGVAAYKSCELVRLCGKAGILVDVVLSEAATHFVTPALFQALSHRPVWVSAWDDRMPNQMAHIQLTRGAAGVVIAPATADSLARVAQGRAEDLLSMLCLARPRSVPLYMAPAMNIEMWENPATQRNIQQLQNDGVHLLGPIIGEQACGEYGGGRMMEPLDIMMSLDALLVPPVLRGYHCVITAGCTEEPIDPVRVITNVSSGKMGYALARAARAAGASVTLISGISGEPVPPGVDLVRVRTALQMFDAVKQHLSGTHLFIGVAAVADYRPVEMSTSKIKKNISKASINLELRENPDILAWVAAQQPVPYCVGFAAETNDLLKNAGEKRERKGIPLIVVNDATIAMGSTENQVSLIDQSGVYPLPRQDKITLARSLIEEIAKRMGKNV